MSPANTFTDLSIQHYLQSVPHSSTCPVPTHLRNAVAAILLLHNPGFPRHFLNGIYVIASGHHRGITVTAEEESMIMSLVRGEDQWHTILAQVFESSAFHPIRCRLLEWPKPLQLEDAVQYGVSLVLVLKVGITKAVKAALSCYVMQLRADAYISEGSDYFRGRFPAKRTLADNECTLKACLSDGTPLGYIQYMTQRADNSPILITGLEIEDQYRRHGFARMLISSVVADVRCGEVYVGASEDNQPAIQLYRQYGFEILDKRWHASYLYSV